VERPVPVDLRELTRRRRRRGKVLAPYALLAPGAIWLLVLFLVPMVSMGGLALQEGNALDGFVQTFRVANFGDVLSKNYEILVRSLRNGAIVVVSGAVMRRGPPSAQGPSEGRPNDRDDS